jgi:hypothetical protein
MTSSRPGRLKTCDGISPLRRRRVCYRRHGPRCGAWDPILNGMVRTTGIEKPRLLQLLNGIKD